MTKIVIERRSKLLFPFIFAMVVIAVSCAAYSVLMSGGMDLRLIGLLLGLLVLLSIGIPSVRRNKEVIVIDDEGITVNDGIGLGPIPWDCISGADMSRIVFDRYLNIHLKDVSKLENLFGEDSIRNNTGKNGKTGGRSISVCMSLCKLNGIDLEALILERARGCPVRADSP
jgi:hypothetical protein